MEGRGAMTRIETAAFELHRLFWENTGDTDEWPIKIDADDEIYDKVAGALNELHDAIEEKFPGSNPWPIKEQLWYE